MLTLPSTVRVFLSMQATDMRCGFDGLSARVHSVLDADPMICGGQQYVAARRMDADGARTCGGPGAVAHHIGSACFEELQDHVLRAKPRTSLAADAGPFEAPPHHLYVGLGVAVSSDDLGVPKPRLDGEEVDPGLE